MDTYYKVIYLYRLEGKFPANSSANFKRKVHRVADAFFLENGALMYKGRGEQSIVKTVVMTTEERLTKMAEAHVQNGQCYEFSLMFSVNMIDESICYFLIKSLVGFLILFY